MAGHLKEGPFAVVAEAVTYAEGGNRRQSPPVGRTQTLTLRGEPRDVQIARAYARKLLGSIPPAAGQDVLVVVNELVSNAVQHGIGPIVLAITLEASEVVVAVTDHGPEMPSFRRPTIDDERGRGLRIVQRLTAAWDVEQAEQTKTITAIVRLRSRRGESVPIRRRSSRR